MGQLGELIPLALVIALSPVAISGYLLVLLSPGGGPASVGFALGWFVGIGVSAFALGFLAGLIPLDSSHQRQLLCVAPIITGGVLIAVGVLGWRFGKRNREVTTPSWMSVFERLTPVRATLVGLGYGAFRPKNLVVTAAASVVLLRFPDGVRGAILGLIVFTVIASSTIVLPMLIMSRNGPRARASLERVREFLVRHALAFGSITLIVIGFCLSIVGVVLFADSASI